MSKPKPSKRDVMDALCDVKTRSICALEHEARGLRDGSVTTLIRPVKHRIVSNGFKFDRELGDILCHNDYLPPSEMLMQVRTRHKQYDVAESEGWEHESPFGPPGARLAVKEAHTFYPIERVRRCDVWYRADGDTRKPPVKCTWRSPATMPAWAVRTHVTVASVRVVRCVEIGEAEAKAWGCESRKHMGAGGRVYGTLIPWIYILEGKWEQSFKRHPFASSWAWVVEVER